MFAQDEQDNILLMKLLIFFKSLSEWMCSCSCMSCKNEDGGGLERQTLGVTHDYEWSPAFISVGDAGLVSVLRPRLASDWSTVPNTGLWLANVCLPYEVTIGGCWPTGGWCLRTSEASEAKWGWFGREYEGGSGGCWLQPGPGHNDHSSSARISIPANGWHQAPLINLLLWTTLFLIAFANMMQCCIHTKK